MCELEHTALDNATQVANETKHLNVVHIFIYMSNSRQKQLQRKTSGNNVLLAGFTPY